MSTKLYSGINRSYVTLTRDNDDTVFTKSSIDRAFELVKQFTPASWGGDGVENNPVFLEAVRLVNDIGLVIDPSLMSKPRESHVARYAHEEIHALMNATALALVDIERENGRTFMETNVPALFLRTMQEMYTGKTKIQIQQMQQNAALSH